MAHPAEAKIRALSDEDVYSEIKRAFPDKTDEQIIAELMRMIVFVAVCYNDVFEGGQRPDDVFDRTIFSDCDDLSGFFPWPE
jgi:ferredoxin-fold anticodon binding domain-containing protein